MDFLQMCGQHKTARRCKQCGMLFVPFSSAAKYCDRKSPNGGQRTCKEVAAEEVAKSRTVDPAVALYTKIGNKLNGRLSRFLYMSDACRKATITRWRAEVKPWYRRHRSIPKPLTQRLLTENCVRFLIVSGRRR